MPSYYQFNNISMRMGEISSKLLSRRKKKKKQDSKPVEAGSVAAQSEMPSKNGLNRRKHSSEAPYIKPADFGKVIFEFNDKDAIGFIDEAGGRMTLVDLYEHMIVFGGSGTGKTYSVLQPLWEEWFRSTHVPDVGTHKIV